MKNLMIIATLAAVTLGAVAPASAMTSAKGLFDASVLDGMVDKRRPRTPGGSGCDTPRDIRQHPECRV